MSNNKEALDILRKCVNVLQGNYTNVNECKKDIEKLLNDIDEYYLIYTGERIIQRETVTEALANGIHSTRKRINYNK